MCGTSGTEKTKTKKIGSKVFHWRLGCAREDQKAVTARGIVQKGTAPVEKGTGDARKTAGRHLTWRVAKGVRAKKLRCQQYLPQLSFCPSLFFAFSLFVLTASICELVSSRPALCNDGQSIACNDRTCGNTLIIYSLDVSDDLAGLSRCGDGCLNREPNVENGSCKVHHRACHAIVYLLGYQNY